MPHSKVKYKTVSMQVSRGSARPNPGRNATELGGYRLVFREEGVPRKRCVGKPQPCPRGEGLIVHNKFPHVLLLYLKDTPLGFLKLFAFLLFCYKNVKL